LATSLWDLTAPISTLTDIAQPDLTLADEAISALGHAARALSSLAGARSQHRHIARRQLVMRELSSACQTAASRWRPAPGRLPDLTAVVADIAATRCPPLPDDGGWSAAIHMAKIAGHCVAAATRFPPYTRAPELVRVSRMVAMLDQLATFDKPARNHRALHAAIPIPELPQDPSPALCVEESAAGLAGALEREALTSTLHLYAVIAAAVAAESVARNGTTVASSLQPVTGSGPWEQAPSAWRVVQAALTRFDDGSRYATTPWSPVVEWALRLSDGISGLRTDRPLSGPADHREEAAATRFAAAQLGPIGTLIEDAVHRWAAEGKLFARARSLPRSDRHVRAVVRDQVIVVGPMDVAPVQASTRIARRLSVALAGEIDRTAGILASSWEPDLSATSPTTGRRGRAYAVDPVGLSATTAQPLDRSVPQLAR
jgi:hypothetical protein